jgi:hypothetical protein
MTALMADPAPSEALEALPDLTLAECCERWGVSSRNSVKARAAALGVELRRESSTRTVWPAEHLALGDELAKHLKKPGGTLANFGRSLTPPADGTDGDGPLVLEPRKGRPVPSQAPSLTPPTDGTNGLMALAQMALALRPPADPLAVPRALQEASELGAWLTTPSWPSCLGWPPERCGDGALATAPGLVLSWSGARMVLRFGGRLYVFDATHPTLALESLGAMAI